MPNLVINVFAKIEEAGQNINKFSLYNLKQFQQVLNHGKNKNCHTHFKVIHSRVFLRWMITFGSTEKSTKTDKIGQYLQ